MTKLQVKYIKLSSSVFKPQQNVPGDLKDLNAYQPISSLNFSIACLGISFTFSSIRIAFLLSSSTE